MDWLDIPEHIQFRTAVTVTYAIAH